MNKYLSRITSSQRGEKFNPLIWPFLVGLFAYGAGFLIFPHTQGVGESSLYISMHKMGNYLPQAWGALAVLTIIIGMTFLLFNIPPAGKMSGLVGFILWVFAGFCWGLTGAWLPLLSIAIPNLYFWFWQYMSLSLFRREDAADIKTMTEYDHGDYDVQNGGKELRESNRGADIQ